MKKRVMGLTMALLVSACAFVGCGKEGKTVTGILETKKDFKFTVEDAGGKYYDFDFEGTPKGYEALNEGDQVKVTYEGVVSEVDPFEGKIISIEKVK